jgi:hypothetical protein
VAAVELPVVTVTRSGVALTAGVADAGDGVYLLNNDGNRVLMLANGGSAAGSVTVVATMTAGGNLVRPDVLTVPASSTRIAGPWPPAVFNDELGGVLITLDPDLTAYAIGI